MMVKSRSLKLLLCSLFAIFVILLTGCTATRVEYAEKKVPVRCDVKKAQLPPYTGDVLVDVPNILIYTEIIERDIDFCVEGKIK